MAATSEALWHVGPGGLTRLTHAEAMERVAPALRDRPAMPGDVALVTGPRVDLATRLALGLDRGRFVRDRQQYEDLARAHFTVLTSHLRHDLLRIPYTHLIMECARPAVTSA